MLMHGREEIKRLKAQNPNLPHKEAFSTAAKNVSFLLLLGMNKLCIHI